MNNLARVILVLFIYFPFVILHADELYSNVGIRQVSVSYLATESEIKGIVWYPTLKQAQKIKLGPFELNVAKDAKIKKGKYSLIIISHGSQGSHLGHRDTAIYFAERGYIVLSVLHPKNNYLDDSSGRTNENWINRPQHISRALDSVLNDVQYNSFIDEDKIAIIGFSAGGYTALSLVGGVPDTASIISHCSKNRDDSEFCGGHSFFSRIRNFFPSLGAENSHIIENTHDQRIKAAVLLAPLGVLFKNKQSLANVNVPLRIYRAEKDEVLRYPYHAESIRQKLVIKPEFSVIKNAGHYSFLSPFPASIRQRVGIVAKDPNGFDRIKFHLTMNQEIFEFLSKSLID